MSTGDRISSENAVDPDFHWTDLGYCISANYLFGDLYSFKFSVSNSIYTAEQVPKSASYIYYESDQVQDPAFYGDLTYHPSATAQLDFGLLFNFPSYNFTFTNAYDNALSISQQEVEPNMWIAYKWEAIKNLNVELGLRLDIARTFQYAAGGGKGYLADPRTTFTYDLSNNASVYLAAGQYHQRIISLNNEDDIYTPFDLIISIPDTASNLDDEEADHFILGGQFFPVNVLKIKSEVYYKDYTKLVTVNRNKVDQNDPDFILGTGKSYGLELSCEYDVGDFYFTSNYSYAKVTNTSDGFTFAPRYDRRHQVNLSSGWEAFDKFWIRAHWEYGSGLPYTPLSGFYPELHIDPNDLAGYTNASTSSQIVFGEKNSARMSPYHRLDASLSYKARLFGMELTSELMLINVYNRRNVFYINNVSGDVEYSLPFIINFSLSWRI